MELRLSEKASNPPASLGPPIPTCPEIQREFLLRWLVRCTNAASCCLETVITTRQYHVHATCEKKELKKTLKQQFLHTL